MLGDNKKLIQMRALLCNMSQTSLFTCVWNELRKASKTATCEEMFCNSSSFVFGENFVFWQQSVVEGCYFGLINWFIADIL